SRILVMPFENLKREGRIFWLAEASAVLLTDDLNALGANAITRQERQQAFERLQVPLVAALTDATVIRIGQLVGAAEVVVGSIQLESDALVVRARSIALDTGRVQADVTDRGPLAELFRTFERIARRMAPPPVLNNLGVVQLRRGPTPSNGQATDYFAKAANADPAEADYVFNLGYAYWLDRDPQAAIYWLREAVRRNPADADAHFVLGAALAAAGNASEATRERELARRLSSAYE